MSLKAQLEAIIYAAETPITLDQITALVKDSIAAEGVPEEAEIKSRVRSTLMELVGTYGSSDHGIEIREVAGGYRMSTKPEQHEVVRTFAKSLKPPVRLSLPALETLAVIAYKQPVTVPEINDIRGVDSGGSHRNSSRSQADYYCRPQAGDWTPDSLQDDEGIPDALRTERHRRTSEHGRIRKAGRGIVPGRIGSD
jgi:segregation and condensation protein B